MNYILIIGDPVSGLSFTGPFNSYNEASEYASLVKGTWWVNELFSPVQDDDYKEMSEEEAQMYCDEEEAHPEDFHPPETEYKTSGNWGHESLFQAASVFVKGSLIRNFDEEDKYFREMGDR